MTATLSVMAPCDGWCLPLSAVPDAVFREGLLGDGIALDPTSAVLGAPFAGEVLTVAATGHAVSLRSPSGVELLVHVGLDTVALKGAGFTVHVVPGQVVAAGERLLTVDLDRVAGRAPSLITPLVITNPAGQAVGFRHAGGAVRAGELLLALEASGVVAGEAAATCATRREARVTVALAHGLHARPAALVAGALKGLRAEVEIVAGTRRADARSIVAIMGLGVRQGEELVIVALGADAELALERIALGLESARQQEHRADAAATAIVAARAPRAAATSDTLTGHTAVPGFALGQATRIARPTIEVSEAGQGIAAERAELDRARSLVAARLVRLAEVGGAERREIVAAHIGFLSDPQLERAALAGIAAGRSAGYAWRAAIAESIAALGRLDDVRLRERIDDLRDIEAHVLLALRGEARPMNLELPEHAVLLADELLPSELVALDRERLEAICLAGGGTTSHVAILAAAMNVPMLVGLGAELASIPDGTPLIVDADRGRLERAPAAPALEAARARAAEGRQRAHRRRERAQADCRTADGTRIEVFANLGSSADAHAAVANGAEGCGLLRTEFLFLERATAPGEAEQARAYQDIASALGARPLVLRLLDVGGDKPLSYLPLPREDNPALGLRGIRTGLARPDLLRTQLRAALRVQGDLRLLVPMVTELAELRAVRALVDELAAELGRDGRTPLGAMIETPAAAVTARQLAAEADFLSIGSNDLSQYTLAMDRGHAGLQARIDALHPAVLGLIALAAAGSGSCPLAVCGGMAADPLAIPLLLGLGISELSVVPARVPATKELVGSLSLEACGALARSALALADARQVRALVTDWLGNRVQHPVGE